MLLALPLPRAKPELPSDEITAAYFSAAGPGLAPQAWWATSAQLPIPSDKSKNHLILNTETGRTARAIQGPGSWWKAMEFVDKILKCSDCGSDFVFTAGEQLFFHDKQFKNDPKRCKQCKTKRAAGSSAVRSETRTSCSACGTETTVPFKPTQGRPVLCRQCFQQRRVPAIAVSA